MNNEVILDFIIWDFEDTSAEQISETLGIQPIKIYRKGERLNPKLSRVAKNNGWRMSAGLEKYSLFETQLNAHLDVLESKIDLFAPICKKYLAEFSCTVFVYCNNGERTPWIHLSSRYNEIAKRLNIDFAVDIYCIPAI